MAKHSQCMRYTRGKEVDSACTWSLYIYIKCAWCYKIAGKRLRQRGTWDEFVHKRCVGKSLSAERERSASQSQGSSTLLSRVLIVPQSIIDVSLSQAQTIACLHTINKQCLSSNPPSLFFCLIINTFI